MTRQKLETNETTILNCRFLLGTLLQYLFFWIAPGGFVPTSLNVAGIIY